MITNLLSNALKFTPAAARCECRCRRSPTFIELIVEDTGRGIPTEHLPHIFDRFYRVPGTGDGAQSGAGPRPRPELRRLDRQGAQRQDRSGEHAREGHAASIDPPAPTRCGQRHLELAGGVAYHQASRISAPASKAADFARSDALRVEPPVTTPPSASRPSSAAGPPSPARSTPRSRR